MGLGAGLLLLTAACGGGGGGGDGPEPARQSASTTVAPVPARTERVQACTLLTTAEIQAAIGSAPVGEGAPIAPPVTHICRWRLTGTGRTFALAVNPASAVPADDDDAPDLQTIRVTGVGDRAEFASNSSQASLMVHVGDTVVSMACACAPALPTQARLVGLAQTVLSRLE